MPKPHQDIVISPLLQDLRAATATLHVALEQRLPFFSEHLDAAWYRRLVQAYYGFYQPLEAALHAGGLVPTGYELQLRRKTPALNGDLLALGLGQAEIDSLPRCGQLPRLDSPGACLGTLYVLEGATLGGQILRREMTRRLGLDAGNGGAFLDVYGAATGRRWKDFLEYLGRLPSHASARQPVISAAQSTFACFEHWLDSREVLL
ncbi:MAG: biliverdin-producing heme oxygenase [Pseudomonas sp.]|uniref:biliverdin-producing heme oxygenase n=1 Tax=unclassified Pseudomonas TaxID=196821 RepID=UPI001CFB2AC5|nr:biliverdin-producing heme oxygenase [Pseudomonas sp. L5B5]UCZ83450.1 biliverdin-producing heme oxygenase [Pseudomonas sp. L5B5]